MEHEEKTVDVSKENVGVTKEDEGEDSSSRLREEASTSTPAEEVDPEKSAETVNVPTAD